MAPSKNKLLQNRLKCKSGFNMKYKKYFTKDFALKLIFDPHCLGIVCFMLLFFEAFINFIIVQNVKYTEIDWVAYMQEVEGFLNGTLDYQKLKGNTGPLVYPAGFVYIYTIFYYITSQGKDIHTAQYIFIVVYLIQTFLVHRIFRKTLKLPPYALVLSTLTSYRIHSIYVLRLFNDPIAVLLFYASLNLFISNKWIGGSIFYSLAVSVKMNILLYAPCLLIAYLTNLTYTQTFIHLFICGFIQVLLGLPFLCGNMFSYLKGSFDLGRVFEHQWTVNYRFMSRDIFENRNFHFILFIFHILLLMLFTPHLKRYLSSFAKLNVVTGQLESQIRREKKKRDGQKWSKLENQFIESFESQLKNESEKKDDIDEVSKVKDNLSKITQLFVLPFFVTNLIGITCARSLHYQFYSWYYHSLVYLIFSTRFQKPFAFLLLGCIEYCWNVYPSTNFSSALLHICHITLLYGVYRAMKI